MNEPDELRDEIASASLDGEVTPEEQARLADEPALRTRSGELAAAAEAISTPVAAPTDEEREAAIAAALVAFDEKSTQSPALVHRIAHRPRWLAAAAAVIAAVAIGGALAWRRSPSTQVAKRPPVVFSAAPAQGSRNAAGGPAAATAATAGTVDIGSFGDTSALVTAVRERLATQPATASAGTPSGDNSPGQALEGRSSPACAQSTGLATSRFVATAHLNGLFVLVYTGTGGDGRVHVVAFDNSCRVVLDELLNP